MERLAELTRLEHDWDSYGAHPPTPRAISMAQAMIERTTKRFDERGVPRDIMPIADGGLSLEWRSPTLELGLNACPEGDWWHGRSSSSELPGVMQLATMIPLAR